jgi:glycosyltransferase involved in cell wall biosynthesis
MDGSMHAAGPHRVHQRVQLHLIASLDPCSGGTAEGLRHIVTDSLQRGVAVEVATLDPPESVWSHSFPCRVANLGPGRLGTYRYSRRLAPWLSAQSARLAAIVVHGLWQYHGLAARRYAHRVGVPYFVYTHGMLDPWFKHTYPLKHLKKSMYWPWAEYRVLSGAHAVLFTCEEERQLARRSFKRYRVTEAVVGLGIPEPPGDSAGQRAAFGLRFPELRDRRFLLFLGRIHPKKGCDLLIEAFVHLAGQDEAVHLVIAGPDQSGHQADLVRRARALGVAQRITWTGMIEGAIKWGAVRAAEALVLPSHQENFGVVVAEALACGVPTLISDRVNIWREVRAAGAGLVAEDSIRGTTQMLLEWSGLRTEERAMMAAKAVDCYRQNFAIAAANARLQAVLRHASTH